MQLVCGLEALEVGGLRVVRENELNAMQALGPFLSSSLQNFDLRELVIFG